MMKANDEKPVLSDFAQMIIGGVRKAVFKVTEAAAEKGKSLVVSDKEGNVKWVPAKDLLKEMNK